MSLKLWFHCRVGLEFLWDNGKEMLSESSLPTPILEKSDSTLAVVGIAVAVPPQNSIKSRTYGRTGRLQLALKDDDEASKASTACLNPSSSLYFCSSSPCWASILYIRTLSQPAASSRSVCSRIIELNVDRMTPRTRNGRPWTSTWYPMFSVLSFSARGSYLPTFNCIFPPGAGGCQALSFITEVSEAGQGALQNSEDYVPHDTLGDHQLTEYISGNLRYDPSDPKRETVDIHLWKPPWSFTTFSIFALNSGKFPLCEATSLSRSSGLRISRLAFLNKILGTALAKEGSASPPCFVFAYSIPSHAHAGSFNHCFAVRLSDLSSSRMRFNEGDAALQNPYNILGIPYLIFSQTSSTPAHSGGVSPRSNRSSTPRRNPHSAPSRAFASDARRPSAVVPRAKGTSSSSRSTIGGSSGAKLPALAGGCSPSRSGAPSRLSSFRIAVGSSLSEECLTDFRMTMTVVLREPPHRWKSGLTNPTGEVRFLLCGSLADLVPAPREVDRHPSMERHSLRLEGNLAYRRKRQYKVASLTPDLSNAMRSFFATPSGPVAVPGLRRFMITPFRSPALELDVPIKMCPRFPSHPVSMPHPKEIPAEQNCYDRCDPKTNERKCQGFGVHFVTSSSVMAIVKQGDHRIKMSKAGLQHLLGYLQVMGKILQYRVFWLARVTVDSDFEETSLCSSPASGKQ
ncbi:unnamed protein product [Cyprideis torosa]|uniref:Uncharacterized protein n=1 Tax=Cyprideis torosa TaxID=163714 RepID=A0A7R8WIB5_9CRUS|nr:unnamed protein product [Cyprideis torosa]CAG0894269.1 unnamed protein product [Cyprideis torosa]